ncbi:MAG: SDR family NAD(P)-dependent oxidoreductase, partial [Leptospiraceae bacterium]|nr:SDR family NAD(P)-dependent oxidoreductase [Leptospiraceae bacterium]
IYRTFGVNTFALFWTTRAFLEDMIDRGGHIVNIASAAGLIGTHRLIDYSSSKFAAVGFDEALRMEIHRLGAPVQTTVVCPYFIDTGMFAGVRSRFSFLLPILKPEFVVREIIRAVKKNRKRLILPRFVYLIYPTRMLPIGVFDWIVRLLGIHRAMDHFHGRH